MATSGSAAGGGLLGVDAPATSAAGGRLWVALVVSEVSGESEALPGVSEELFSLLFWSFAMEKNLLWAERHGAPQG